MLFRFPILEFRLIKLFLWHLIHPDPTLVLLGGYILGMSINCLLILFFLYTLFHNLYALNDPRDKPPDYTRLYVSSTAQVTRHCQPQNPRYLPVPSSISRRHVKVKSGTSYRCTSATYRQLIVNLPSRPPRNHLETSTKSPLQPSLDPTLVKALLTKVLKYNTNKPSVYNIFRIFFVSLSR